MLNLTEQEVMLLEAYRGMDNQSREELWEAISDIEEQAQIRNKLHKLEAAVELLQKQMERFNKPCSINAGKG